MKEEYKKFTKVTEGEIEDYIINEFSSETTEEELKEVVMKIVNDTSKSLSDSDEDCEFLLNETIIEEEYLRLLNLSYKYISDKLMEG